MPFRLRTDRLSPITRSNSDPNTAFSISSASSSSRKAPALRISALSKALPLLMTHTSVAPRRDTTRTVTLPPGFCRWEIVTANNSSTLSKARVIALDLIRLFVSASRT